MEFVILQPEQFSKRRKESLMEMKNNKEKFKQYIQTLYLKKGILKDEICRVCNLSEEEFREVIKDDTRKN